VFALPSFSAAANYRLTPVAGGIAGPVPGFKDVKSDLFAKALRDANQIEYAAAVGMADNALKQKSAIVRRGMLDDATMAQLEFVEEARKKQDKRDKLLALAGLTSGGNALAAGGRQSARGGQRMAGSNLLGPLETLAKYHRVQDGLDNSMYTQMGVLNKMDAGIMDLLGPVPTASTSGSISLPEMPKAGVQVEPAPTTGNTYGLMKKWEAEQIEKLINSGQLSSAKA
jgi:hypothetical protein